MLAWVITFPGVFFDVNPEERRFYVQYGEYGNDIALNQLSAYFNSLHSLVYEGIIKETFVTSAEEK
jgi:hypothetical protein